MTDEPLPPVGDANARVADESPPGPSDGPLDTPDDRRTPSPIVASRPLYAASKRVLDIVFALSVGTIVLPAVLAIVLAIRINSEGPALFLQTRAGQGGRPFRMVKFRSMRVDAAPNAEYAELNITHGPTFKALDDPRVTKVGRFLRRWSLDELPQLWNVLRGEMSLVGPRPLVLDEDAQVPEYARLRSAVKPGMSGAWQVAGRSLVPFDQKLALDLEYVRTRGMRRDLAILARTPWAVISRRGAF